MNRQSIKRGQMNTTNIVANICLMLLKKNRHYHHLARYDCVHSGSKEYRCHVNAGANG